MNIAIKAAARCGPMFRFREELGISQAAAAKMAGLSHQQWNKMECLDFRGAGEPSIRKVAELVGVSLYEIVPPELAGRDVRVRAVRYTEIPPERLLSIGKEALSLPAPEVESPVNQAEIAEAIDSALQALTYREREIIKLRFGIESEPCTLKECASVFRVTQERARQIEAKAVRKMQRKMANSTLQVTSNDDD